MPIRTTSSPKVKEKLVRSAFKGDQAPDKETHRAGADEELENQGEELRNTELGSHTSNGGLDKQAHRLIRETKSTTPEGNH